MMRHRAWHWGAAAVGLVVVALIAVALGAVRVPLHDLFAIMRGAAPVSTREIVLTLRAPRVVLAALVGAALGASGATMQATLRNPLAEPYLLGVSGGAAVGAVGAMVLRFPAAAWPIGAFIGSGVAVALALGVARGAGTLRAADPRTLLMAGVVVGALANAIVMIALANVPPETVRGALWWMMGSVGDATWTSVAWLAGYALITIVYLLVQAPTIDALTLGDDAAAGLGVQVESATTRAFLTAALLAAATVAAAGLVGFVGLIVPYLARGAGLSRQRDVLVGSLFIGAALVIVADLAARVAMPPSELPLGAVTAVLGVPFFLVQLRRLR